MPGVPSLGDAPRLLPVLPAATTPSRLTPWMLLAVVATCGLVVALPRPQQLLAQHVGTAVAARPLPMVLGRPHRVAGPTTWGTSTPRSAFHEATPAPAAPHPIDSLQPLFGGWPAQLLLCLASCALGALAAQRMRSRAFPLALTMATISSRVESVSAPPGTLNEEAQPVVTPLDAHSHVLVVGASRGIGLEFVKQLLPRGCAVTATHREAAAPGTLTALAAGGKLQTVLLDVADEASIFKAAAALQAKGVTFTHVVHNAGVYGDLEEFDGEQRVTKQAMMDTFAVNSVGPLLVAQAFAPLLAPSASCPLPIVSILTSKMGSVDDNGSGGSYAYRASKAACNMIAKSLYVDLRSAKKATVCLLHPGYVRTHMTGFNGLIDPDVCVAGLLRAIEATGPETPFRWVDYKACQIPW